MSKEPTRRNTPEPSKSPRPAPEDGRTPQKRKAVPSIRVHPCSSVVFQFRPCRACSCRRGSTFKFLDDLEDAVAAFDRVVHDEAQMGGVFQYDFLGDQPLDARAVFLQQGQVGPLRLGSAEYADKDPRVAQIATEIDVIDGNKPGVPDRDFAADGFAD